MGIVLTALLRLTSETPNVVLAVGNPVISIADHHPSLYLLLTQLDLVCDLVSDGRLAGLRDLGLQRLLYD